MALAVSMDYHYITITLLPYTDAHDGACIHLQPGPTGGLMVNLTLVSSVLVRAVGMMMPSRWSGKGDHPIRAYSWADCWMPYLLWPYVNLHES